MVQTKIRTPLRWRLYERFNDLHYANGKPHGTNFHRHRIKADKYECYHLKS